MNTFEMKTAIHFGDNALDRLKEIPYKRVLIITDPFVVQSKMINLITAPLNSAGIEYDIFHDVVPDAPVDKIAEGVKKFLEYQPEAVEPQARALLKRMGVDAIRHHRPSEISGGEGQRAAIARAVIAKPGIIFADEPTGALNRSSSLEVLDLLTELSRQGQSLVMVTHDVAAAVRGNRILYVEEGQIVMEKTLPRYDAEYDHQRQKEISGWLIERNW